MILRNVKAYYARILGKPSENRFEPGKFEWTIDVAVDDETKTTLLEAGVSKNYIKEGDEKHDGLDYIKFRRNSKKADGTDGAPISVVDHRNQPWDQSKLIGNGSTLNLSVALNEVVSKGKMGLKPGLLSIQVWDLVPYARKGEFEVREDTEVDEQQRATQQPATNW